MTQPFPYNGLGTYSPKALSYSIARKQISQYGSGELAVAIVGTSGEPAEATDVELKVFLDQDWDGTKSAIEDELPIGREVASYAGMQVIKDDVGLYHVDIGPEVTKDRGNLTAVWTYEVMANSFTYTDFLEIIEPMPHYDALRPAEKTAVEQVAWMFADLFDSTSGGPNLTENFQTHFNYDRIAQLMGVAMIRINTYGVPITSFGLGEGSTRLPHEFSGLLVMGTYLEVLRHFIRSYTEQPTLVGMTVTYTDRRDYADRWRRILDEEKVDYDKALKLAKRKLLGLGRGSLLVAGGVYGGNGSRNFFGSMYAAQVRSARFYPYASTIIRL